MEAKELTRGIESFNKGFNLKEAISELLKKNKIEYKRIVFYKESPYQKKKYKKEFVGQEVWVMDKNDENICITQDLYEDALRDQNLEFITLMFN